MSLAPPHLCLIARRPRHAAPTSYRLNSLTRALLVLLPIVLPFGVSGMARQAAYAAGAPQLLITAIDTMKESRDTETRPLSDAQIAQDVDLSASLHATHITVDTHWDYPDYMQRWVQAVRATGRHVWFRIHPNQWGDNNGTTGTMTPAAYETSEQAFIATHASLFQPGDILDPCPEPENGLYWRATYGSGWTAGAPNAATREYNSFIRTTTAIADTALHAAGISGVITTVRSTNGFFATHPGALEPATVAMMGRVTVDSYPDSAITDPAAAAAAWTAELASIESIRQVPVVIGEMGYSRSLPVDDATQSSVLTAELNALAGLPYLAGINYWVGAGTNLSGGYTHLFSGAAGSWTPRPAASALAIFFTAHGGAAVPAAGVVSPAVVSPTPGAPTTAVADAPTSDTSSSVVPLTTPTPGAATSGGADGPGGGSLSSGAPLPTSMPLPAVVDVAPAELARPTDAGSGCLVGWTCADIGDPSFAGSQSVSDGALTVQGSGWGIWYGSGAFHYLWQTLAGDGSFSARIVAQRAGGAWAKAGIMLSQSSDAGAPHYAVFMTPGHGVVVQYRVSQDDDAIDAAQVMTAAAPLYLRIVRTGATYSAYTSDDGSTWSLIPASTVTLPWSGPLLAGIAVTSHDGGSVSMASFDHLSLR